MKFRLQTLTLSCALMGGLVISTDTFAETLLSDQYLLAEPSPKAAAAGQGKKGQEVSVLAKKGFWVQVKAGEVVGWTKLNNVKAESSSVGLASLETGRQASGNIVSTSGVRGLDGGDLEKAQPNPKEFAKLAAFMENKDSATAFAKAGKLQTRTLDYVQTGTQAKSKKSSSWLKRK
ncbi:MAG: hypothetical protein M0Q29_03620 [Thiopseudomonas sp.]|nr:hypothetical protein [Thiopseudomonas sp.]